MRYHFRTVVRRVVDDTITLSVEAPSLGKAKKMAEFASLSYPHGDELIPYCYIENRETVQASLLDIERMVKTND